MSLTRPPSVQEQARAELRALGVRLDEAAARGASGTLLDALLGSMSQAHERISEQLAQELRSGVAGP
ncbi:hypothetical protein ACFZB9_11235 [Kitasatospora sp. NPDC008050]|uniref:hypothetical protein n=1 Tax=Kitasatospora sp. NPDC008050 TaxID=3364021 RepID=UPI0036ED1775